MRAVPRFSCHLAELHVHTWFVLHERCTLVVCRDEEAESPTVVKMALWCLNPAVAFAQLSAEAHSVVLTSGTLSPKASFASEVGASCRNADDCPHDVSSMIGV